MMFTGLLPIDSAASIRPCSTCASADSTCRAKNGTEAATSGTITPRTPIFVPIIAFVTGSRMAMKITKGIERQTLMSLSNT